MPWLKKLYQFYHKMTVLEIWQDTPEGQHLILARKRDAV